MSSFINWFVGKRTYLGLTALAIIGALVTQGVISAGNKWVQLVTVLVTALTGVAARASITRNK